MSKVDRVIALDYSECTDIEICLAKHNHKVDSISFNCESDMIVIHADEILKAMYVMAKENLEGNIPDHEALRIKYYLDKFINQGE